MKRIGSAVAAGMLAAGCATTSHATDKGAYEVCVKAVHDRGAPTAAAFPKFRPEFVSRRDGDVVFVKAFADLGTRQIPYDCTAYFKGNGRWETVTNLPPELRR